MANWYVRPGTSHSATRNGTSYATAWGGWSEIAWGSILAGESLYVCGAHSSATLYNIVPNHNGTSAASCIIRGDYAADLGSISFTGTGFMDMTRAWTTLKNLTVTSAVLDKRVVYISANGFRIDGCKITGGTDGVAVAGTVILTVFEVTNSEITAQTSPTGYAIGYTLATGTATSAGIRITGNKIHDVPGNGIGILVSGAAGTTSQVNDVRIADNHVYNTGGKSIQFTGTTHATTPTVYSSGVVIENNNVHDCGTIAGDNGLHGGIGCAGASGARIYFNKVKDCYVTGAGIQTARNIGSEFSFNRVSGIRSGTPTGSFQNGLPIDGHGVFIDNYSVGCRAFGNHVSDLVTTGNVGSGAGLAFWEATNCTFTGNVVENCAVTVMYGSPLDTGNTVYNNTFINCVKGVAKVNGNALAGNMTVKNNIFKDVVTCFDITANPSITADYNCLHGYTTAYSGISAGANDTTVDPDLDAYFCPQNETIQSGGARLGGVDFRGKNFTGAVPIGAVAARATRTVATRSVSPRRA